MCHNHTPPHALNYVTSYSWRVYEMSLLIIHATAIKMFPHDRDLDKVSQILRPRVCSHGNGNNQAQTSKPNIMIYLLFATQLQTACLQGKKHLHVCSIRPTWEFEFSLKEWIFKSNPKTWLWHWHKCNKNLTVRMFSRTWHLLNLVISEHVSLEEICLLVCTAVK